MTPEEIRDELDRYEGNWEAALSRLLQAIGFTGDDPPLYAIHLRNAGLSPLQAVRYLVLLGEEKLSRLDDRNLAHHLYLFGKARAGGDASDGEPF